MNVRDAKMIIQLGQLSTERKTAYALAGLHNITYLSVHQRLKILEAMGFVNNVRFQGKKSIWLPTEEGLREAKNVLL